MTEIHSRARNISLSVAGILALVLFVGLACLPRELRADAASRMASLAEDFDTALADTWHLAFPERASDHAAASSSSASHKDGEGRTGTQPVWAEVEAVPSRAAGAGTMTDVSGFGTGSFIGSFNTGTSADSQSNSMSGLLSDILKDGNAWADAHMGFEAFAGGGAASGNAPAGFGFPGEYTAGMALAGLSRTASPQGLAPAQGRSTEGVHALAEVNPNAQSAYPDSHREKVAALGRGFGAVSDAAGASGNRIGWSGGTPSGALSGGAGNTLEIVGSSKAPSGPVSSEPGNTLPIVGAVSEWSGASHGGGGGNADPTTVDPVRQLLGGLDHPLQGEDHGGSVSQNEVNDGAASGSGDGNLPDFNHPAGNDSHPEDHGSTGKPVEPPDPVTSLIASVPEPGSLALLSLGLGAVILWRRFLSAH